ncbi:hypothetical protein C2E23DRAFT_871701 [Lenzites betulinus]|nr:hypothetical protein C2E23DRAFT_871701 [Lenzites betulinus]
MNQAPPYPYQPNGNMARFADESNPAAYGAPPHAVPLSTRSIRPTIVPSQSYPGQASYIIYTDDANTKLSDRVRRKCFNCRTTDTSTWRRSSLTPGKVLCNKCGLFERTHSRPRPEQFPPKRGPVVPVNSFKQHRTVTPPSHAQQQQQQQQQQQHQRLPPMSSQMLPPHHYSHPSLSPLMAARSADPQQYRAGEIGALLNGPGESQANGSSGPSSGAPSAGGSPQLAHQQSPQQHDQQQQQQQQQPNSLKRPASPLERQYQPPPPPQMQPETIQQHLQQQQQQQQASAHSSPQISAAAAGASNSPKSSPRTGAERRDAPAYRASN